MVRVGVNTRGLAARLDRLRREVETSVRHAVEAGAEDLRQEARTLLDTPGTAGPSAPGAPPRRRTGRLRDSLFVEIAPSRLSARVGTDLDYGGDLEFGTQVTASRPWLLPAARNAGPRIEARIAEAVQAAIRRSAGR